jgi:hypothetical protein
MNRFNGFPGQNVETVPWSRYVPLAHLAESKVLAGLALELFAAVMSLDLD